MLCKGFPGNGNSDGNSDGKAQNKTRMERKLGDGAKFIVPAMYPSMCVSVCVCVAVLCCHAFLCCCCCCCSGCACCNTINFRFCLSRKVAALFWLLCATLRCLCCPVPFLLLLLLLLCFYYWPPYFYGAEATAQLPVALFKHDVYVICCRSPAPTIYWLLCVEVFVAVAVVVGLSVDVMLLSTQFLIKFPLDGA